MEFQEEIPVVLNLNEMEIKILIIVLQILQVKRQKVVSFSSIEFQLEPSSTGKH